MIDLILDFDIVKHFVYFLTKYKIKITLLLKDNIGYLAQKVS